MDTLPAGIQVNQANDWISAVASAMTLLLNPALIAIVLNTVLIQAVEAWDNFLPSSLWKPGTKDISKGMAFTIAWLLTLPFMAATCWLMHLPFRGVNAGFAILSGPVALVVSELLKKAGINLDTWFGQDDSPATKP